MNSPVQLISLHYCAWPAIADRQIKNFKRKVLCEVFFRPAFRRIHNRNLQIHISLSILALMIYRRAVNLRVCHACHGKFRKLGFLCRYHKHLTGISTILCPRNILSANQQVTGRILKTYRKLVFHIFSFSNRKFQLCPISIFPGCIPPACLVCPIR